MASINTASKIISHLKSYDRLSLYSSSCPEPLIITEDIRTREIKKTLDAIGHAMKRPSVDYLRQKVQQAREELRHGGSDNKHIVVLTCNSSALDKVILDDAIRMHVLCPGPLSWTYFKSYANDGWFITGHPCKQSSTAGTIALRGEELQRMVLQLRTGQVLDFLEKVNVTVIPRSQDMLHDVLGATFIQRMNVGESRTLLVKCGVQSDQQVASVLESFPNDLPTPCGQLDLEREIDVMLGCRQIPTIIVKVQYHHSALGSDTLCELSKDIFGHQHPGSSLEIDLEQATIAVQNRMLHYLATSETSPRKALILLSSQPYNVPYHHILLEELKYRTRIQERYALDKNQVLPVLQKYSLFPNSYLT